MSVLTISSCNKEKVYPDPDIDFIQEEGFVYSDTTMAPNDMIRIALHMESRSDGDLFHFNTTVDRDGQLTSIDTALNARELDLELSITKSLASTEIWSFYCRDRDSRKSEVITLTLTLDTTSVFSGIKYVPSLILGGQRNSEKGSFYSLTEDKVLTLQEAFNSPEKVNFAYYYDTIDSDEHAIASPGANIDAAIFPGVQSPSNWSVKNTTRYVKVNDLSPADFEACRNDSLILAHSFDFSTGKRKAKKLTVNDVYSFENESGKKGLFIVKNVSGKDEGSIEISLKMLDE